MLGRKDRPVPLCKDSIENIVDALEHSLESYPQLSENAALCLRSILDGLDGSHLTVAMIVYDSAGSASDAYASIRQDYYCLGGSDDLGVGNRSCYIRMAWTDTGTDAYILAAFQKANVVVTFDFVPGYADLSVSDLKDVAWEQYDKIQN